MKVMIDTNVLLDYVSERQPFVIDSSKVIKLCIDDVIDGCISVHTVTNLFYILRKEISVQKRRELFLDLCRVFTVVGIDSLKLETALNNDAFDDLEDCLQDECAKEFKADYTITRNMKHFDNSSVKAIEPKDFVKILNI